MTFKKALFAGAAATTIALAGTGVASAEENAETPSTNQGSLASSVSSATGSADLAPTEECKTVQGKEECSMTGPSGIESSTELLTIVNDFGGAVAGSISILPEIYEAIQGFQDMVDDISGNIQLPKLPF